MIKGDKGLGSMDGAMSINFCDNGFRVGSKADQTIICDTTPNRTPSASGPRKASFTFTPVKASLFHDSHRELSTCTDSRIDLSTDPRNRCALCVSSPGVKPSVSSIPRDTASSQLCESILNGEAAFFTRTVDVSLT
jgi:hypothetical protein